MTMMMKAGMTMVMMIMMVMMMMIMMMMMMMMVMGMKSLWEDVAVGRLLEGEMSKRA